MEICSTPITIAGTVMQILCLKMIGTIVYTQKYENTEGIQRRVQIHTYTHVYTFNIYVNLYIIKWRRQQRL